VPRLMLTSSGLVPRPPAKAGADALNGITV
jgi:hypothetical protein